MHRAGVAVGGNRGRVRAGWRHDGVQPTQPSLTLTMKRSASAVWQGSLKAGKGTLTAPGGALKNTEYSFGSRFESGAGTNPEELIAAAHAGCFAMALSAMLGEAGITPERLDVTAE